MKITHIVAAALMVAGIGVSGAASAQMNTGPYAPRGEHRMDHRGGDMRDDHGQREHRGDMRDRRDDRRSYGRNDRRGWNHGRQQCRTEWRHHRRVRICR